MKTTSNFFHRFFLLNLLNFILLVSVCWTYVPAQNTNDYELKQVLIFGRHHVRAPYTSEGSVLHKATNKTWPAWDVEGTWLTTKGGVLEAYLGSYTRAWLKENGLLQANAKPQAHEFLAYANSMQRTVATAQYFIAGAFPAYNVPVHHTLSVSNMDKLFTPAVHNDSEEFIQEVLETMQQLDKEMDLTKAYKLLDKIVAYKDSDYCREQGDCSLAKSTEPTQFTIKVGNEPSFSGRLRVAFVLVDAFNMQYYEGLPKKNIAWGKLKSKKQWKILSDVTEGVMQMLFTSGNLAQELAAPLVNYIDEHFNAAPITADNPLVTLMIGHDSNVATLLKALNVEDYVLPDQFEHTPIGGQLVFQRWENTHTGEKLLKIEYVYQTRKQIREVQALNLKNPPQRVPLYLNGLKRNADGYMYWDDFKQRLQKNN